MLLYVFNPEHDYALANNDPHFMAPASAIRFADECALFLQHLIEDDAIVFRPYQKKPFYSILKGTSVDLPGKITDIRPWGWDKAIQLQMQLAGVPAESTLSTEKIEQYRELAHRKTASEALQYLRNMLSNGEELPNPAEMLTSLKEVETFTAKHEDVIFKSPYSSNGRGHLYAHKSCSPTLLRQAGGVIRRQGAIMAEKMYDVVQDFAMEFHCNNGNAVFSGYSLFSTMHYGYAGNLLWSDNAIEEHLCQWTTIESLHEIRQSILQFLQTKIAPFYHGYLGVDMFIYNDNGFKINPMVEINLRMTMGMAAHLIYERHVHNESVGELHLEYCPQGGELLRKAQKAHEEHPFTLKNGCWHSGFHSLTPIDETTQYAFFVLLHAL